MNHSIVSADRNTHLKSMAVALIGAILVVIVGITGRTTQQETAQAGVHRYRAVLTTDRPVTYTQNSLLRSVN